MQILRSIIYFFLIGVCSAQHVAKPNQEVYSQDPTVEVINKHLQENYNISILKKIGLIMTGQFVKDPDKNINNRTYTNLKIEF